MVHTELDATPIALDRVFRSGFLEIPGGRIPWTHEHIHVAFLSRSHLRPQAVHLHRVHNIDLFCRGVYYLRASVLLPAKDVDVPTKRDAKSGGNKGSGHGSNANGGGNAADGGSGSNAEQVEAQGIPYMCLAQCQDMETTVGHRKVPPLKVCCLRNTKQEAQNTKYVFVFQQLRMRCM